MYVLKKTTCEGVVASWLVHLTPDRAVRVLILAGGIVFCSWGTFKITLTVLFHPSVQMGTSEFNGAGNLAMG